MKDQKAITIYDIASLAEVSPATVSNVINGKGKCSAQKKERILQVMKEVGYTPNVHARRLHKRNRYTLAINFNAIRQGQPSSSPFSSLTELYPANYLEQFWLGAIHAATKYDCDILFTPMISEEVWGDPEKSFSHILEQSSGYDGLIVDHTPPYLKELSCHSLPYVYTGPPDPAISLEHNVYGGLQEYYQKVLQVFYEHRITKIVFFLGILDMQFSHFSRDSYLKHKIQEFCTTHHLSPEDIHVMYYDMTDPYQLTLLLSGVLKGKNPPEGMFFTDTPAAVTAYNYLQENGIRIPEHIRIIATTFSASSGKEFVPALSSIFVNSFQMGFRAVELLLHQLDPKEYPKKDSYIPFQYMERESV